MDVPVPTDADFEVEREELASIVTSHETSPGNVVFTERDNTDGWIATDLAVELVR